MKNIIKNITLGLMGIVMMAIAVIYITHNPQTVKANVTGITVNSTNQNNPSGAKGSSTINYMSAGNATTTYVMNTSQADDVTVNVAFSASTSAATLGWQYEFTSDSGCNATSTTCNWYEEDANTLLAPTNLVTGLANIYQSSTTITHTWSPGSSVATTSYKAVVIPKVTANAIRIKFFIPIGSVSGGVYVQSAIKNNNNQ